MVVKNISLKLLKMMKKSTIKLNENENPTRMFLSRFNVHLRCVIVRYLISKLFFKWKNGFPIQRLRNEME